MTMQRRKGFAVPELFHLCHFESSVSKCSVAFQRKKTETIGIKAPLPAFIEPASAIAIAKVPSGTRWIHEIKFDGWRKMHRSRAP
jgi:bifunctional non-homologous end joining protein LigD